MTRACNKHSLHPVKGYNQCPGCEVEMYKKQLTELAEAAENMLTLLVDNAPIEGLWLSNIDEWDCLIKEVQKK